MSVSRKFAQRASRCIAAAAVALAASWCAHETLRVNERAGILERGYERAQAVASRREVQLRQEGQRLASLRVERALAAGRVTRHPSRGSRTARPG